jgi:cellulose synthase (UDP-forming)
MKWQYGLLVILWVATNLYFWTWWLSSSHVGTPILFVLMSAAFFYDATLLPTFYIFYLGQMRRPKYMRPEDAQRAGIVRRVAMITLTVPGSESIEIVRRQLEATAKVTFVHDSWILVDKCHSPEIEAIAKSMGVQYFCRHDIARWGSLGVAKWNRPTYPFKEKTKAGNVNAWLDAYGAKYSHFTQLDIDHVPQPEYLDRVLGYFLDSKVAWVQAPSVYGNLDSWTARGAAEQEFVLQGPLQAGFFGFCGTPFIIGSHCTYDMGAIRKIGGFQPTRAEDHLDTVVLAASGREGVFVPEVIAAGSGPENFDMYVAQQFAWAHSMIQVLLHYTPYCIMKYSFRQMLQFLFVQTWYPLWSLSLLTLFTMPVVGLLLNKPIADVGYGDFMLHCLPTTATALGIWFWSRRWHNPKGIGLSWRGIVLHIARWPVVLSAMLQAVLRVEKPYMITIKGLQAGEHRPFAFKSHMPYLVLIGFSLTACWAYMAVFSHSQAQGYLLFALQGAMMLLMVYVIVLFKDLTDMVQEGVPAMRSIELRAKPIMLLLVMLAAITFTGLSSVGRIAEALSYTEETNHAYLGVSSTAYALFAK